MRHSVPPTTDTRWFTGRVPDDAPLTLADLSDRVEAISALYARTFGIDRDADWFALKLTEEVGELMQAFLAATGRTRPREEPVPDGAGPALADEVADVLAHLLLLARSQGVDVDAAVRRKWLSWEPKTVVEHPPSA
ncbi:pyrophosphatase [Cellulosimicrobium terreum]|nr:pyrophosphatase [Cellulosimicrobium terreum]